ncbi:MAG: hypothetical protein HND56_09540 [Pseudomonadota bacterium]|nr:hypothetical protein [Pseudomonadota bacterium]QKK05914.1 MAG: hypothetical protein HND56_09540 [Pseudomonadota bacterium]
MDGQGYAKSLSDGAKILGAAILGIGIGFGLGIAAGPGIIGSIVFGVVGAALGGAAGYVGGVVAVDGVAELKKLKNKIIKRAKPHAAQAKGYTTKLRQDMSEAFDNASQKLKNIGKTAPKTETASKLGDKTVKADFEDKSKQTEQTVTETPAPAQKADVKKTTGAKRKSAK